MLILLIWKGKKDEWILKTPESCAVSCPGSVWSRSWQTAEKQWENWSGHTWDLNSIAVFLKGRIALKKHIFMATLQTWLRSRHLSLFCHHHRWFSVTLNENTYLLVSPKLYLTKLWKACQGEASPCNLDDSPSERGAPPEFLCLLFKHPLILSIGVNFHQ